MEKIMLCACFILFVLDTVLGSGQVEIQFVRYDNPGGKGDNGNACDGVLSFANSACDPRFTLCVDWADHGSGGDMDDCHVGRTITGEVHNQDSFDFSADIGGTANPVKYSFSSWQQQGIVIKVDVTDHDDSTDPDHIELFDPQTVVVSPAIAASTATSQEVVISGRTTLKLNVKVYCDPNWYGGQCSVQCTARDDSTGHYTCKADGSKECLPGWEGNDCHVDVDDCASAPCLNGADCVDGFRGYSCVCGDQFTGSNCEQAVPGGRTEKPDEDKSPDDKKKENGVSPVQTNLFLVISACLCLVLAKHF